MKIAHVYADEGVEAEALAQYGTVFRFGTEPSDKNQSQPIKADAKQLPIPDDTFTLGLFHPPCGFVSPLSDTKSGDREDWNNMIPAARKEAQRTCDHYIIENKAEAAEYMIDPVILEGEMFGKPYEYRRAFETTFPVTKPAKIETFGRTEMQPFFNSEHSKARWAAAKGYSTKYQKGHLSKNCVPRVYIEHLL